MRYLETRGIQPEIIDYCFRNSLLFESLPYHNVIFVGYDKDGIARSGSMRGTMSDFRGEVKGSDKKYSFSITDPSENGHLHLFESAIDLLSYASLELLDGRNWKKDSMLSLAGVSATANSKVVPKALKQYLERSCHIGSSPFTDLSDHRSKGTSALCEGVFGLWRYNRVYLTMDQSIRFQFA